MEIEVLETYCEVPIVELRYSQPTLLSRENHEREIRVLLDLPFPQFAVLIRFSNFSCCVDYGPAEMSDVLRGPLHASLRERCLAIVRYGTGSLTSMVQLMSAQTLLSDHGNAFAADRSFALRMARHAVDSQRVSETEPSVSC